MPTPEEELAQLPTEWNGATLEKLDPPEALAGIFLGPADAPPSTIKLYWAYNFGTVAGIVFVLDDTGQAHVGAWRVAGHRDLRWFTGGQRVLTRRDAAYAWLLDFLTEDANCTGLDVNVARARLEATRNRFQAFKQTGKFVPASEPPQPFWEHLDESAR